MMGMKLRCYAHFSCRGAKQGNRFSSGLNQPDNKVVPLGNRCDKKFNSGSGHSTIFPHKPIVVLGGGLFA
jgi:hypothetical protein